jgi:hypothetical protein
MRSGPSACETTLTDRSGGIARKFPARFAIANGSLEKTFGTHEYLKFVIDPMFRYQ